VTGPAYDLAVVGAGPAGAAAALRACQLAPDARVLLLDRAEFPRDKPCGDGISAHSVAELGELGALDVLDGYEPVDNLHVRSPLGVEVAAPLPQACAVVPRRVFDARLVELAVARGVELRRHRVRTLERRADRVVIDGGIEARAVVGADGANSVVRRQLGIAANAPEHVAIAVRGYVTDMPGLPPDELLIVLEEPGSLAYAWAFPLPGGGANVGYGRSAVDARADEAGGTDQLAARMRRLLPPAGDVADLRAHRLPLASAPVRQPDGRVLLAGDALSYVNPITGEGIHHALRSGRLAAEAAAAVAVDGGGDAGVAYRRALHAAFGRHLRQTSVLSRLCRQPGFIDAVFDLAGRRRDVWQAVCDSGLGAGIVPSRLIARQFAAYLTWRVRHVGARVVG